jgi:hypothetical protein
MLLLGGCTPRPPTTTDEVRREASIPAVPPLVRHVQNQPVHTVWTFRSGDEDCVAVAAAENVSLVVTVNRNASINLAVSVPGQLTQGSRSVPLRFTGPSGTWQVAASRTAAHQISVGLSANDIALSRILVLLNGGVLDVGTPPQPIVSLAISPSEAQGQTWFDCARGKVL